jgi:protein tyrosine phosphatase (PTP) superfamily phosphohydrolase (DUF442 family)
LPLLTANEAPIPADAVKVVPQGGWKRAGQRDFNAPLQKAELGNTRQVHRAGEVWLAGQPAADDIEIICEQGVCTVVTMRKPDELDWDEQQVVTSEGLKFQALPIEKARDFTDEVFDRGRQLLKAARQGNGVLLHCASANRVGALWLVHRVLDGRMAVAEARKEAARVGLRNQAYEAKALDYLRRKGKR